MTRLLKGRLGLVALVVLLAIPLALILSRAIGGFVRDLVVVPFLYLGWMGQLYLRAIPQILFWGALLLFGLILVFADVLFARRDSDKGDGDYRGPPRVRTPDAGPVRKLTAQIHSASGSRYFRAALAQRLGILALEILDEGEDAGQGDTQQRLDALEMPPEVRAFLTQGKRPIWQHRDGGLLAWLRRRLQRGSEKKGRLEPVEQTVRYLEDRMEGL